MGYMRHHAIVVSSYDEKKIAAAHVKASEIGCNVTPLSAAGSNGYTSFLVAPDGSKEGWPQSNEGDLQRELFRQYLNEQMYDDFSTSLDWVEVQFGDDEKVTEVTWDSDEAWREHCHV